MSSSSHSEMPGNPDAACPLQILKTYIRSCKDCNPETFLHIEAQNNTTKRVTGTLYRAEYEDAVGTKRERPEQMVSAYIIQGGKTKSQNWDLAGWISESMGGAEVWIQKVKFEDGTTWEGQGRSCGTHTIMDPAKAKGWWTRH